jgi:predicted HTH domain antitoxin
LRYNTFADEFNGISSIQPVYNTAIRLMNMENSAAEAAVKTANPLHVVTTSSKSPQEILKWSRLFGRISGKEQITLPFGTDLKMISPGNQNFNDYAEYFLDAVVAALGVPKIILTGISGSGSGNRSTGSIQSRHFYSVIRANQRYVEQVFNDIFRRYGEMAGFKPPKLVFNDIAEDAATNSQWAIELFNSNLVTLKEAREMIGLGLSKTVEEELRENEPIATQNMKEKSQEKEDDKKVYHPQNSLGQDGSQKGEKRSKKIDPDVPSVR